MQWPPKFWQAKSKLWQKPQTDEAFRSVAPIVAAIGGLMLWHSLQPSSPPGPGPTTQATMTPTAKTPMPEGSPAQTRRERSQTIGLASPKPAPANGPSSRINQPQASPGQSSVQTTSRPANGSGQFNGSWAFGWLLLLGIAGEIALLAWLYGLLQQLRAQRRRTEQMAEQPEGRSGPPISIQTGVRTDVRTDVQASVQTDIQAARPLQSTAQPQSERLDLGLADLRTRLITTISHTYRTPLTTILTTTELLERYGSKISEANKQRYTQRIRQSVQEMTDRLDEVLLLHQGSLGQMRCQPQPVDVWLLCQDLLEAARLGAPGHSFFLNDQPLPPAPVDRMDRSDAAESVGDRLPPQVQIDPQLARSTLTNLLTNAVQFSPQGGRIQLAVMYQDLAGADLAPELREAPGGPPIARSGFVIFQLRDEGIGISAADQAHLGEPFYRGSNVGDIRGAGLGLAIAQQCVAAHGGSLQLISELGQGTTVRVTLPIG